MEDISYLLLEFYNLLPCMNGASRLAAFFRDSWEASHHVLTEYQNAFAAVLGIPAEANEDSFFALTREVNAPPSHPRPWELLLQEPSKDDARLVSYALRNGYLHRLETAVEG